MKNAISITAMMLSLLLQSCGNHVLLANHTVLGVDITNENGANAVIGFKRSELANVPKRSDGSAHSTLMSLDNAYNFGSSYCVSQLIATGGAANAGADALASSKGQVTDLSNYLDQEGTSSNKKHDPLVFYTYTSWGIGDLNLSVSNPQNSLSFLHFKRSEGAIVPVDSDSEIRPIFGSFFLNDRKGSDKPTQHIQIMATGEAAIRYASNPDRWTYFKCNPSLINAGNDTALF